MNGDAQFDQDRSQAIRAMLIETVSSAPARRRTRRVRVLIGIIVAAVLATGGTTAIALGGGVFVSPTPPVSSVTPPAGTPAGTQTPPPTTPSAVPGPEPVVATLPIAPHDVPVAPTGASWSIDLPGSTETCMQHEVVSISNGFALFQAGPKITSGDFPDPCDLSQNELSLTLVDTNTGTRAWSRSWMWDGSASRDVGVDTLVLGTSGRILVNTQEPGFGPEDVLDLASGVTIGSLALSDGEGVRQIQSVAGDSGEVVAAIETFDSPLQPTGPSRVARFDPRDASHPIWSTVVPGSGLGVRAVTNEISYTAMRYSPTGLQPGDATYVDGVLNLTTGEISLRQEFLSYDFFTGYTIRPADYDTEGNPRTLTGLDDEGNQLWKREIPAGSSTTEVLTPTVRPGSSSQVGNGRFLIASADSLTLVDGLTNATIWTTHPGSCDLTDTASLGLGALVSADGSTLVVNTLSENACRFDAVTGTTAEAPSQANWSNPGNSATYELRDGIGTSTDWQTGETEWSTPSDADAWLVAGGQLVARKGNTITAIG